MSRFSDRRPYGGSKRRSYDADDRGNPSNYSLRGGRLPASSKNGKNLDDYELRRIGSEIEGLIKLLLQQGLLSYNPECRVMNYSMGLPKTKEVL